jgi:hypothetical protein
MVITVLSWFGCLIPKKPMGTDELSCISLLFAKQTQASRRRIVLLATSFMLLSCLVYYFTLKMKATCSCEMSVDFQRRYIPEDRTLHNHLCDNFKSYILYIFFIFEVFTTINIKIIFCDVTPCNLIGRCQCFYPTTQRNIPEDRNLKIYIVRNKNSWGRKFVSFCPSARCCII